MIEKMHESNIASYPIDSDDPMHQYVSEPSLNSSNSADNLEDPCQLSKNLLQMLLQQDHAYLIFVDGNNVLVYNKKLLFDATTMRNLDDIEKALDEIERSGKTMEPLRFQRAMQWHTNNAPPRRR